MLVLISCLSIHGRFNYKEFPIIFYLQLTCMPSNLGLDVFPFQSNMLWHPTLKFTPPRMYMLRFVVLELRDVYGNLSIMDEGVF